MDIINKTILVVGLGNYPTGSGVSAALFCARRGAKKVIVTDIRPREMLSKTAPKLLKFQNVEFVLGRHRLADVARADIVVKNPGVPDDIPIIKRARALKKIITNDIGLFLAHKPPGKVVGVTGTRGKSTTTALIYEFLKKKFPRTWLGGNIGVSPLQFIEKMKSGDITVLELSSWMLHDLKKPQCDIAVVTNILPDHLDRYRSMQEYQRDKERIWRWQTYDHLLVLNARAPLVSEMHRRAASRVMWFGKNIRGTNDVFIQNEKIYFCNTVVASAKDIQLRGHHNRDNVCAAIAVAKSFGVSNAVISAVLRNFHGLPHRLALVRTVRGVQYFDDTTATTPDAGVAALAAFDRKVILIAGGRFKVPRVEHFLRAIRARVKFLIVLDGPAEKQLISTLPAQRVMTASVMRDAVKFAATHARKGDIVLLSPGCTWLPKMNEFERARQFIVAVRCLL